MTNEMIALLPTTATAWPDNEKIPAAIIVPSPSPKATQKPNVRVCSHIRRSTATLVNVCDSTSAFRFFSTESAGHTELP